VSVVALVTVIACAVVAASVAAWSGAQAEVADARGRRAVGVNLAVSGVEGVVSEVAAQRKELLRGGALKLTDHALVWQGTDSGGAPVSGVVRLVPIGGRGETSEPEASKLDLNEASEEQLKHLGVLTTKALAKVVSGRSGRAWGSVWEIIPVESPGQPAGGPASGAGAPGAGVGTAKPGAGPADGESPSVEDVSDTLSAVQYLTCYSADPQERSGFTTEGALDADATGRARLALPEAWGPESESALAGAIGEKWATWMAGVYKANKRPASAAALGALAAQDRVDPGVVAGMLDALEFDDAGARRGLVDLLTAPSEVLSGIPGIGPAVADRIVTAREKLDPSRRGTVLWPVLDGLVELGEFAPALDFVASRCLVFRVMVEGGTVSGELRGEPAEWALKDRWAYEAIVDASETPVRIAYLRSAPFDALVVPGAREPEPDKAAGETTGAPPPPPAKADAPEAGESEPHVTLDFGMPSSVTRPAPVPAGSSAPSAAVDSPASAPEASLGAPARSRIGRWNGGGSGGGSGAANGGAGSSGGMPK
jgi:DNA uptake protein ComE-like DNA-binding protein